MGIGDSVPGISGGTIAVITHIYDTLIYSIRAVHLRALRLLASGQAGAAWRYINGNFLIVLALGILSGLVLSARTVLYLLDNQFAALMAFFIGLVLASSWLLRGACNLRAWPNLVALGIGAAFTVAIGLLLGSLPVLWSWQQAQSYVTDSSGELHILRALNVWPWQYTELTGQAPQVLLVVGSLLAGGILVLGMERIFTRTKHAGYMQNLAQQDPGNEP